MTSKLKLTGNLRCKSELILAEKIKRMNNGIGIIDYPFAMILVD